MLSLMIIARSFFPCRFVAIIQKCSLALFPERSYCSGTRQMFGDAVYPFRFLGSRAEQTLALPHYCTLMHTQHLWATVPSSYCGACQSLASLHVLLNLVMSCNACMQ